ncbi:MAG: hypothetical protein WB622_13255 [Acidobacteriaceae bacterium]|jgi:hypothetical protein
MASPQHQVPRDPAPQEYVDTRGNGRGPGFRWWWLWVVFIIAGVVWYFAFSSNGLENWHQRHDRIPSSTPAISHPRDGTSAPENRKPPQR